MPIGDLLAEITGEKPPPAPAPTASRSSSTTGIKRKADGDTATNGVPNKSAKQSHSVSRDPVDRKPSPLSIRPGTTARAAPPANGQRPITKATPASNDRPYTGTATPGRVIRKPVEPSGSSSLKKNDTDSSSRPKLAPSTLGTSRVAAAIPSPTTPTTSGPAKVPKKGSLAEILARGAKAQQTAPKAGVYQHKAISETITSKKDREEQLRNSKWKSGRAATATGPGSVASRDKPAPGTKNGVSRDSQIAGKGKGLQSSSAGEALDKKVKKAAMATTGYTGTARPPPKRTTDSKDSKSASGRSRPAGGLLAPPRASRRDRYEDEDSELDDFVVDDEDEEELPPRGYRYADYESDSDMEAGADDIYMEEQKSLRQARQDDAKEEAMLEKLRREKEARKRRGGY
ncbi:hypothetical protein JX265_013792 [Neoarthrinium moseri]|uniref:SPT2 chromatin protein n=1 Tax=Neoarthrinium moseri TaxID=1658444 RepID=A0A9P9W7U2_9PEZI|nr:uncharacterized protein JN550_010319 [Neoarthrinium moseri]KAI1848544.1 hypothetical protein JX265_013792 [Neoarthrinium moseri]KAI1862312.1 hypothetical protein JN550_010319 [Neoarthrinium moseri]